MTDELNQVWKPGESVVQAYVQGALIYHQPVEGVHKATDARCWCGPRVEGKYIPCDRCGAPKTQTLQGDGCLWHFCDRCAPGAAPEGWQAHAGQDFGRPDGERTVADLDKCPECGKERPAWSGVGPPPRPGQWYCLTHRHLKPREL